MTRPVYLGIDLGTTNSTAAFFDGEQVGLVRNAQGSPITPSVVRFDARGNVTVGQKARRLMETDPQNARGEFKRLMGTAQRLEFPAAKLTMLPEQLSAEVLKSLREDVRAQLGFEPERAVISVPALFEVPQSAATAEAARLAGFERVELIQEPVASALSAGWSGKDANGAWLVYDLGGGTFDASLLETRDGLLRVIGHDGDNFLGGRDFDWSIVEWILAELAAKAGKFVTRADPRYATGVRRLKLAVEEAKIELSRAAEASVLLPAAFEVEGTQLDVDVTLRRDHVSSLCLPLVDRSIEVCRRLIRAHGLEPEQIQKLVLVGGPTVTPFLRERLTEALAIPFAEQLDPMTVVAQGAALYAATAGLDARPKKKDEAPGRRFWLQYPAVTSDLSPHVVGKLVEGDEGPTPAFVALVRSDGWKSAEATLNEQGAFVLAVDVLPRRPNEFRLEAKGADGTPVPVRPATLTVVQGLTISDPPLSRTIGVALANDLVHVYFERGAPLPAKRTFRHHTVESVAKGSGECVLKVPIVQGELELAHQCRLIGSLEIRGDKLTASLPSGALVELTIELDRGGRLFARAQVPSTGQVFEHVAQLLVPDAAPEALEAGLRTVRDRLAKLRGDAFRRGHAQAVSSLAGAEHSLAEIERDIAAARGGDADSGQRAKRALVELDVLLEECELDAKWPELDQDARETMVDAAEWVSVYGSPSEQRLLREIEQAVEKARAARQAVELQRQLKLARRLRFAAYYRNPQAWSRSFEDAASRVSECSDLVRAQRLVEDGQRALARDDLAALRGITEQLWRLLPADAEARRLGFDSGLK